MCAGEISCTEPSCAEEQSPKHPLCGQRVLPAQQEGYIQVVIHASDERCENGMCAALAMVECHVHGLKDYTKKVPEVFVVRHIHYTGSSSNRGDPIPGKLFVYPIDKETSAARVLTGCSWPIDTIVSLGEASRRIAETGGDRRQNAPSLKSSTDILALTPDYPRSTRLTRAIATSDYPPTVKGTTGAGSGGGGADGVAGGGAGAGGSGQHTDPEGSGGGIMDDPPTISTSYLMEILVEDVRAFMTRSGSQDRHLWRTIIL